MKTILAILFAVVILTAFKIENSANSIAAKRQGIDVYVMAEPARPYEVIKTVSNVAMLSCKELINTPVNAAAKIEGAQGVIIYFPESGKYSVIKYKD